jgi:hypothetical protein
LLLTGAVLEALCPGEAVGDAEELLAEEDVLAEDDAEFGAAVVLGLAFGLLLVQLPWVSELVVALAAEADVVAAALPLALLLGLPLGLAAALLLPAAGLAGELDVVGVGVIEAEAEADAEVLAELAELTTVEGAGDAEDCGHDEIGVGAPRCFAAVVRAAATPPLPSTCPPPPAAAAPGAELADGWLLSTPETDEATAWRSGGTEASTTPTTNTAQATAIAGLSIAIRQSRGRCWARPWPRPPPADPPPCRAYQRRTVSARKPELAGTGEPECLLA